MTIGREPSDPFSVLGVEARFDLDLQMLTERHRELSRTLHPDRYALAPSAERRMALSRAIEVNEAFRALRDPIKRAEALAKIRGLAVGETTEPPPKPDLLMEMMEAREELADAAKKKDASKVSKLGDTMRAREKTLASKVGRAFDESVDEVLPLLGELRYVRRFLDEVDAFEESLL